jgi:peroxiredoxin
MLKNLFRSKGSDPSPPEPLVAGLPAPPFSLPATGGEPITLDDFRGQPVVLIFYPRDESAVCGSQLALYNEALALFKEHDAQLLAISVDDLASHKAFARSLNLKFPLLSDSDPAGTVAQAYGVLNQKDGRSERALFVVDDQGIIRWSHLSPRGINPGANGILDALESLPGKVCKL